jgi:hypothetical protein
MNLSKQQKLLLVCGLISATVLFIIGTIVSISSMRDEPVDLTQPVRPEPEFFKRNTHMPNIREGKASGSIDLSTFSEAEQIIRIDDPRVWWESDNDSNDTEDDHLISRAMEIPLKRLIELVSAEGAQLKIQDTFRPKGIHNPTSLHKEGRAIDLTCRDMSLTRLSKLCWASGFSWVYFEDKGTGAHVHCSVQREPSGK